MKDYKSKTGNGLLAICMGKNYQDSMVVYREYVQNACDSIYEAMNLGYYSSDEEKIGEYFCNYTIVLMWKKKSMSFFQGPPAVPDVTITHLGSHSELKIHTGDWLPTFSVKQHHKLYYLPLSYVLEVFVNDV